MGDQWFGDIRHTGFMYLIQGVFVQTNHIIISILVPSTVSVKCPL